MSGRRDRRVRVRLEGLMSEAQIEFVGETLLGQLIGRAGDLAHLDQYNQPDKAIEEVAILGRLVFWLGYEEILVPDPGGEELMRRTAREIDGANEAGELDGVDPATEHDAMWAFVGLISDWPAGAEVHDARRGGRASAGERDDGVR